MKKKPESRKDIIAKLKQDESNTLGIKLTLFHFSCKRFFLMQPSRNQWLNGT